MSEDEFAQATEIVTGLYYFLTVKRNDSPRYSTIAQQNICYCIDEELLYEPFFADFGPLNLGRTYRFCQKTKQLLQEAEKHGKRVYLYTGPHAHQKANAAVLVGIFQVIYLNRAAEVAYKPLASFKPFVPFRDASCGVSTFHLTVYDVIRGIQRARDVGFLDWNSGTSTWSLDEYEHYEQVENGDLNWILPGKFLAFSGPAARSNEIVGYRLHTPEDYWDYFRRKGVTTIIRLNKKVYDRKRFLDGGFKHHEMYFPDGSCPTEPIIQRFLDTVEAEPGCIAVHCKAGLGRTGLLICLYIMKHYRFTAEEVIGYIRVCRPGSVIGPQQNFLREMEARMWHEGELYRAARGLPKVPMPSGADLVVAGRTPGHPDRPASGSAAGSVGARVSSGNSSNQSSSNGGLYRSANANQAAGGGSSGAGGGGILATSASSAAVTAAGDMSLLQYSKMQTYNSADYGAGSGGAGSGGLSSAAVAPTASYGGGSAATGTAPAVSVSAFRSRYSSAAAGYSNGAAGSGAAGRSMTPLRYGQQSAASGSGYQYGGGHNQYAVQYAGVASSHAGALQGGQASRGSLGLSVVSRSMPAGPTAAVGSAAGRTSGRLSAAAGLAAPPTASVTGAGLGGGGGGLRSTLHTDTLAAADRPKYVPERNAQSADMGSGFGLGGTSLAGGSSTPASSWRISVGGPTVGGSSGPGTPTTPGGGAGGGLARAPSLGSRSGAGGNHPTTPTGPGAVAVGGVVGGVARILAPNGQPRKVPVALLSQYTSQQGVGASNSGWAGGSKAASANPMQLRAGYSYGIRQ